MRRFINGFIALILAAGFIVGTFYLLDITRDKPEEIESTGIVIDTPVYDRAMAVWKGVDDLSLQSETFCTCVDDYVMECVAKHGGGTYTDTHGHRVKVEASGSGSSGATYHYYDDYDDNNSYTNHTEEHHDEGGSSGTGWVPSSTDVGHDFGGGGEDIDLGNYCSVCGTVYYGTGLCPNGCQD